MSDWKKTKTGEFLKQYKNIESIKNEINYKLVTISNTGNIYLRKIELGSLIKANKLYKINHSSFIYSRLSIHSGAFGLVPKDLDGAVVTDEMPVFKIDEKKIDMDFFIFSIRSHDFIFQLSQLTKGVGRVRVKESNFLNLEIYLPPLQEQKQIAEKLKLGEEKQKILAQQIANQKVNLKNLRKQILQDAIQGKLTKDWRQANPNTEPASELLKKIKQEKEKLISEKKIKKEKPLPAINENEIPFELPKNWILTSLGELVSLKSGNTYSYVTSDKGILYVRVGDMNLSQNSSEIVISSSSFKSKDIKKTDLIPTNSIIFPKRGGAIATNKKRKVLKEPILIDSNTMAILVPEELSVEFVFQWFQTVDISKFGNSSVIPQVNNKDINPIKIPLPPIAEQLAIVSKLQTLMQKIDEAEQQVEKSLEYSKQLSNTILSETFNLQK